MLDFVSITMTNNSAEANLHAGNMLYTLQRYTASLQLLDKAYELDNSVRF